MFKLAALFEGAFIGHSMPLNDQYDNDKQTPMDMFPLILRIVNWFNLSWDAFGLNAHKLHNINQV